MPLIPANCTHSAFHFSLFRQRTLGFIKRQSVLLLKQLRQHPGMRANLNSGGWVAACEINNFILKYGARKAAAKGKSGPWRA
jgi:hypothetical protein